MKRCFLIFIYCLIIEFSIGQVVINELDSDTPSTDTMEFIELKSDVANFSLDGYVLVLFNGSNNGGDTSYFALDLDGLVTDVNGILLIGNNSVSPVPEFILFDSTIQNGADAVAIYAGDASDFPEGTLATTTNLIDALVHDTSDADDTGLLGLLNETVQIDENQNGNKDIESIQLNNDQTSYTVTTPTPGVPNDGSGVQFNGVSYTTSVNQLEEGGSIDITFMTEENVTGDLNFDFTINNKGFGISDFTGSTSVTILDGMNMAVNTIVVIDDATDEGDEEMKISFGTLPSGFVRLNDNKEIRVVDNDFTVASWGTPLNPTFGNVSNTVPMGYYDTLEGLSGSLLRQGVQDIIADPATVRAHTYADIVDILNTADQSPENSNKVWLLYSEESRPKLDFQGFNNGGEEWNREHTYPRSRGGFNDIDADDIADGIDVFVATKADSLRHANSDAHGLRAADRGENSSRGNQDYGEYAGPAMTQGSWKGDVARGIFFLAIRYNDLDVVPGNPDNSTVGQLGDLTTLLDWHRNDPPDDFEMNRNNIIYTWQRNRNPFIDQPDLVEYIWGNQIGESWSNTLSVMDREQELFYIYPNPATHFIMISANDKKGKFEIYDMLGNTVLESFFNGKTRVDVDFSTGVYLVRFIVQDQMVTKYLLVK